MKLNIQKPLNANPSTSKFITYFLNRLTQNFYTDLTAPIPPTGKRGKFLKNRRKELTISRRRKNKQR